MKIFILGSEGAGKTVFLAMLSRYLREHPAGIELDPADFQTSEYVANVQCTLENGEWPPSNRIGQSFALKWTFGALGSATNHLVMYDAAGQDLRTLMLAEDLENLSPEDRGAMVAINKHPADQVDPLREQINSSDVLVYLLDLEPFLVTGNRTVQNEHCWLLKTFLAHPRWKEKKRIVLLSKKDKYDALLARSGNDVRKCVKAHLPTFCAVDRHIDQSHVEFSAISSIATDSVLDADGTPLRMPRRPFQPGDLSAAVRFLADAAGVSPSPSSPSVPSVGKVECYTCGALIQASTSARHGGKCAICAKQLPSSQGTGCLLAILVVLGSAGCASGLLFGAFRN